MRQLVNQVWHTRYQVPFYLWWIEPGLNYCKVAKYYYQDCRIKETFKSQDPIIILFFFSWCIQYCMYLWKYVCRYVFICVRIYSWVSNNHPHPLTDFRTYSKPSIPLPILIVTSLPNLFVFHAFNSNHLNLFSEFQILALNQFTELTYFSLWKPGFIYVTT